MRDSQFHSSSIFSSIQHHLGTICVFIPFSWYTNNLPLLPVLLSQKSSYPSILTDVLFMNSSAQLPLTDIVRLTVSKYMGKFKDLLWNASCVQLACKQFSVCANAIQDWLSNNCYCWMTSCCICNRSSLILSNWLLFYFQCGEICELSSIIEVWLGNHSTRHQNRRYRGQNAWLT